MELIVPNNIFCICPYKVNGICQRFAHDTTCSGGFRKFEDLGKKTNFDIIVIWWCMNTGKQIPLSDKEALNGRGPGLLPLLNAKKQLWPHEGPQRAWLPSFITLIRDCNCASGLHDRCIKKLAIKYTLTLWHCLWQILLLLLLPEASSGGAEPGNGGSSANSRSRGTGSEGEPGPRTDREVT